MNGWVSAQTVFRQIDAAAELADLARKDERLAAVRRRVEVAGLAGSKSGPLLMGKEQRVVKDMDHLGHRMALHVAEGGRPRRLLWYWTCSCGRSCDHGFSRRPQAEYGWSRHEQVMQERAS